MGITLVLPVSVHVITVLFFQGVRHSHLFTSVGRCWGFDSQRGCAQKETNFQKQSLAKALFGVGGVGVDAGVGGSA